MPIVKKAREHDFSIIDLRTITPEGWEAVKHYARRQAHAERAKLMRDLIAQVRCWWLSRKRDVIL